MSQISQRHRSRASSRRRNGREVIGFLLTAIVAGARTIGRGLVVLGLIVGAVRVAGAQAGGQTLDVQVNTPYIVQYGFGSYEVGGLSVDAFRIPIPYTFPLGAAGEDAWQLAVIGYPGYGHASFESRALGPKITASEDFVFLLFHVELQIPLRRWWTLKPFVEAGLGEAFNGSVRVDGRSAGHVDE